MPESIANTDKLDTLQKGLNELIACEQDSRCRTQLIYMQNILEELVRSNTIIDAHTMVLRRHNDSLVAYDKVLNKSFGILILLPSIVGLLQILLIAFGSYIFVNTQQLLHDNAVIMEKIANVTEEVDEHKRAMTDIVRRLSLPKDLP